MYLPIVRSKPGKTALFSCQGFLSRFKYIHVPQTTRFEQEAQLPQRNSASAAHMEEGGLSPPAHSPFAPSGYTYAYGRIRKPQRIRMSSVPSVKRSLRWIGHSRSFKVILIGAGTNPERCVVVIAINADVISKTYENTATGKRQIRRFQRPHAGLKTSSSSSSSFGLIIVGRRNHTWNLKRW